MEEVSNNVSDLERGEWQKLFNHPWYQKLPERLKKLVKERPPFYLYKMRSTGHFVTIHSYNEDKFDDNAELVITVKLKPEHNKEFVFERELFGVPKRDLEPFKIMAVARVMDIISGARSNMKRLINPRDRNDVLRGN